MDHSLGPDKPQVDHQRFQMTQLEVVQRLGKLDLDTTFEGGDLQLMNFLGQ